MNAVAARSTGAASALAVGAISVEGVSQENADAQMTSIIADHLTAHDAGCCDQSLFLSRRT